MNSGNKLNKIPFRFAKKDITAIFATAYSERELSSAGSEHLPYKQGVTGSNPVAPTKESRR